MAEHTLRTRNKVYIPKPQYTPKEKNSVHKHSAAAIGFSTVGAYTSIKGLRAISNKESSTFKGIVAWRAGANLSKYGRRKAHEAKAPAYQREVRKILGPSANLSATSGDFVATYGHEGNRRRAKVRRAKKKAGTYVEKGRSAKNPYYYRTSSSGKRIKVKKGKRK